MICLHAKIHLCEDVFFASVEIGRFYQTYPVIGNYALAYALGLVHSKYHDENSHPSYVEDFQKINEQGIYITPAQPIFSQKIIYSFHTFNALNDRYYFKMDKAEYNYPRMGKVRTLAPENIFEFFLFFEKERIFLPNYIRLGKWMSKAKVTYSKVNCYPLEENTYFSSQILTPIDFSSDTKILEGAYISMYPTPLLKKSRFRGKAWKIEINKENDIYIFLPQNMKFAQRFISEKYSIQT